MVFSPSFSLRVSISRSRSLLVSLVCTNPVQTGAEACTSTWSRSTRDCAAMLGDGIADRVAHP